LAHIQYYYYIKKGYGSSTADIRFQPIFQDEVKSTMFTRGGDDDLATIGGHARGYDIGDEDEDAFL
jgi:hypothetical protein